MRYTPPTREMRDSQLCHHCNQREIVPGLMLPSGVPACRPCFDRLTAAEAARKREARAKSFNPPKH